MSEPFSDRVLNHAEIAYTNVGGGNGKVLAMPDQLIVRSRDVPNVKAFLEARRIDQQGVLTNAPASEAMTVQSLGEVFGSPQLNPLAIDDYTVVQVGNLPAGNVDAIFNVTNYLRASGLFKNHLYDVSPNHILAPSPLGGAGCPFGPPFPAPRYEPPPAPAGGGGEHSPVVTVIDAGYQDWWKHQVITKHGDKFGPWGANPLHAVCDLLQPRLAPYLKGSGQITPEDAISLLDGQHIAPTHLAASNYHWVERTHGDVPAARLKGVLDAMAGHANFVAGVVAQGCDYPTIDIWSHSGLFEAKADYSFPNEASICHSILMSQAQHTTRLTEHLADVIQVGFAFPLVKNASFLPNGITRLAGGVDFLSGLWAGMFQNLWKIYDDRGQWRPMVVAPAGNENSSAEYFPAALKEYFNKFGPNYASLPQPPHLFDNVIGVASLGQRPSPSFTYEGIPLTDYHLEPSPFSNHGDWVTCSANGESVHSAFMPLQAMKREDDESRVPEAVAFPYPAAIWNGTSFAAPRVSAAIAARAAASGKSPLDAWNALLKINPPAPDSEYGIRFESL